MNEPKKRSGGIDPAALAAAALAAAISTIAPSGPYGPASMVIGITILLLILAYDVDPHRSRAQSVAFSAVVALIALLSLGFPMECVFAAHPMARLHVLLKEIPQDKDLPMSEVPPLAAIVLWMLITIVLYWRDRRRRPSH
jgi:uncharacterized BrkB/YihY/UPF0761 family membrane protein